MINSKKYLLGAAVIVALSGGLFSCQDHFDDYVPTEPVATLTPNMTILELKELYWDENSDNYIYKIGYTITEDGDTVDDGKDYIISGRVISSDESSNIYKNLFIQDETAALPMGVNNYNLYLKYRVGQEIVINLKGMYCGKYSGLFQLGFPSYRDSYAAWAPSFMAPEFFYEHIELNGYPDTTALDTIVIDDFSVIGSTTPAILEKYQGQLVRFNNIYFQNGGEETYGEYHVSGTDQTFYDAYGNSLVLRTSGYSDFWNETLPTGNGDMIGILSYYGSSGWQVYLNSVDDVFNFGNPTVGAGAEDNPMTVEDAIAYIQEGSTKSNVWVSGYIVGAVAPEVTEVTSNDDIEWSADVTLANTLVIGANADTKDIANCLVISLPQNTALRVYGNLVDNPDNYQKEISVCGTLGYYMEAYGVLNNNGRASEFKIEGETFEDIENDDNGSTTEGDGSSTNPYTCAQVISMYNASTTQTGVWVQGYIVGYMPSTNTYIENTIFSAEGAVYTNLVLGPTADCTDYTQCVAIQLPSGSTPRTDLNLGDNPSMLGALVNLYGDVEKYCGGAGLKSTSEYVLVEEGSGDDSGSSTTGGINDSTADGKGTEADPYSATQVVAMYDSSTTASDVWVKGYIVGYIPSTNTYIENTVFSADGAGYSNLVLGPTASCTDYTKCVAVQLTSGYAPRTDLNLGDNPSMLGTYVELYGNIEKYCGGAGLKSCTAYNIITASSGGSSDDSSDTEGYTLATSFAAGTYVISTGTVVMTPLDKTYTYGYMQAATGTLSGNTLSTDSDYEFTFTATDGGYYMQDTYGRYYYQSGTYNSFNVSSSVPSSGAVWTVTIDSSGYATITNVDMDKTIQYSSNYSSYGSYSSITSTLPNVYKKN